MAGLLLLVLYSDLYILNIDRNPVRFPMRYRYWFPTRDVGRTITRLVTCQKVQPIPRDSQDRLIRTIFPHFRHNAMGKSWPNPLFLLQPRAPSNRLYINTRPIYNWGRNIRLVIVNRQPCGLTIGYLLASRNYIGSTLLGFGLTTLSLINTV